MSLPLTLPERPEGWTKRMSCHFNLGGGYGAGSYEVFNAAGEKMPICFQYNTKQGYRGFTLPNVEAVMTWRDLRNVWTEYLERVAIMEENK